MLGNLEHHIQLLCSMLSLTFKPDELYCRAFSNEMSRGQARSQEFANEGAQNLVLWQRTYIIMVMGHLLVLRHQLLVLKRVPQCWLRACKGINRHYHG